MYLCGVLVDGGGNLIYAEPKTAPAHEVNRVVIWLAAQPNVQVLRTRDGLARFDHRKLVLVDDRSPGRAVVTSATRRSRNSAICHFC